MHFGDEYVILSQDAKHAVAVFTVLVSNEGCALSPFDGSYVEDGVPYAIVPEEVQRRAVKWKRPELKQLEKWMKEKDQEKRLETYEGVLFEQQLYKGVSAIAQLMLASRLLLFSTLTQTACFCGLTVCSSCSDAWLPTTATATRSARRRTTRETCGTRTRTRSRTPMCACSRASLCACRSTAICPSTR